MKSDLPEYYELSGLGSGFGEFDIPDFNGPDQKYQQIQNPPLKQPRIESNVAFWAVIDGVLLVFILAGNILTILAVRFSRRLRSVISNMFILSLAISDMVVGFTLPYHLAFYMGSELGHHQGWCLLRFFLIILACCVSIWNLIAIAVDRYIAIVYPLHYSRYMTKKVALILLSVGWILGATFAFIPMFWNNWETANNCEFNEVLPPWYMAGVITPGFSMVWVCMLIVYWRIWREASKHAKQLRSSFTGLQESPSDWKSVQVVLLILGCFSICWLPYFIVACAQIFKFIEESSPVLYKGAFSLAMANSGMNPIIYAWKNTSFRRAFARLLRCKSPDYVDVSQHSTRSNIHRKSSSLQQQDTLNMTISSTPPPHTTDTFNELCDGGRTLDSHTNSTESQAREEGGRRRSLAIVHATGLHTPIPEVPEITSLASNGGISPMMEHVGGVTPKDGKTPISTSKPEIILNNLVEKCPSQSAKNLLIQKVECDGNGNTQVRIVNEIDFMPKINNLEQSPLDRKQQKNGFLARLNTKCRQTLSIKQVSPPPTIKFNSKTENIKKIETFTNGKHSVIDKHTNGNLIINHLDNIGRQIL